MDNDKHVDRAPMVAHDEHLLALYRDLANAEFLARQRSAALFSLSGFKAHHDTAFPYHVNDDGAIATIKDAVAAVEAIIAGTRQQPRTVAGWDAAKMLAVYRAAAADMKDIRLAIARHEDNYTGWSRFFLVTSSDGHIHRHTNCSTCYPTTRFAPLPNLSGLTEHDAVADQGEILCSVCFPDAPVAWTSGVSKATAAEREARAAAKAERDAKKRAKAIREDGEPLRFTAGGRTQRIETIHAAKTWLTDAAWWNASSMEHHGERHPSFPADAEQVVAEALAARTGEPVEQLLTAAAKRAAKR